MPYAGAPIKLLYINVKYTMIIYFTDIPPLLPLYILRISCIKIIYTIIPQDERSRHYWNLHLNSRV
jgi:hypothetical protein